MITTLWGDDLMRKGLKMDTNNVIGIVNAVQEITPNANTPANFLLKIQIVAFQL